MLIIDCVWIGAYNLYLYGTKRVKWKAVNQNYLQWFAWIGDRAHTMKAGNATGLKTVRDVCMRDGPASSACSRPAAFPSCPVLWITWRNGDAALGLSTPHGSVRGVRGAGGSRQGSCVPPRAYGFWEGKMWRGLSPFSAVAFASQQRTGQLFFTNALL